MAARAVEEAVVVAGPTAAGVRLMGRRTVGQAFDRGCPTTMLW
jgi:hypothetical protein